MVVTKGLMSPGTFIELAWRGFVARGFVEEEDTKSLRYRTTIKVYYANQDIDHNRNLFEVTYICEESEHVSGASRRAGTSLELRSLGTAAEEEEGWKKGVQELLESWGRTESDVREWCVEKPFVFVYKGPAHQVHEIAPMDIWVRSHLIQMQYCVARAIQKKHPHGHWLCQVFYGLGGLINEQTQLFGKESTYQYLRTLNEPVF